MLLRILWKIMRYLVIAYWQKYQGCHMSEGCMANHTSSLHFISEHDFNRVLVYKFTGVGHVVTSISALE